MGRIAAKHCICPAGTLRSDVRRALKDHFGLIAATGLLAAVTLWSYWPVVTDLFKVWRNSEDYSAGQLVPLVAVVFIWRDRKTLRQCPTAPCWWAGGMMLALAEAARMYGYGFSWRPSVGRYAFVLAIAGLVLMVAGWQVLRRVKWVLLFLFLMFPLPGRIHNMVSDPLQRLATTGSVFFLEAFGVPVGQQGNIVMLNDSIPMAVAEACSGLRMLTAFIIVAAFIAYMVKRPRWQKAVLLASSIPVAVVSNMIRIMATGVIMLYVSVEIGEKFFHDFAGLVMMPAAVSLIFGLLWLMDLLTVPEADGPREDVIVKANRPSLQRKKSLHKTRRDREFSAGS